LSKDNSQGVGQATFEAAVRETLAKTTKRENVNNVSKASMLFILAISEAIAKEERAAEPDFDLLHKMAVIGKRLVESLPTN
jgi:hypothetical protein